MRISRIISGIIALGYLAAAYRWGDAEAVFDVAMALVFVLALIWFSEEIGNYKGVMMLGGPMTATPGTWVAIAGWLFLLAPLILGAAELISRAIKH